MNKLSNFWQKCEFSTTVTLLDTLWHSKICTQKLVFEELFELFFVCFCFFHSLCDTVWHFFMLDFKGIADASVENLLKIFKKLCFPQLLWKILSLICVKVPDIECQIVSKFFFKALERLFLNWKSLSQVRDLKLSFSR